jgi:replication factor A1
MKEIVYQILTRLKDQGVEVPEGEIESRLRMLIEDFRVPESEARRSVLNYFLKEHGLTPIRGATRGASEKAKVSGISEPGKWIDLEVKVLELWDPTSSSISQTGLVGDETGSLKFVKWAKAGIPDLEEGKSYLLKNVTTDEYQGRFSVKINRTSEITPLERQVEAKATGQPRGSQSIKISEVSEPGKWVDLRAKVVQLWDPNSESISQTGLVGDETGSLKFVKWAKAGIPDLEEGKSYLLKNVTTDEYQGRFSVKINRTSEITPLEEDIAVGTQAVEFTGAMVDVQKGSGLIKRCPVCKRSLAKGLCGEHGKVEGIYDLRIKGVLDDGKRVQDVLINREITESLIGLTLEEAKKMAMEALDHEVVRGLIEEKLMGRYYTALGTRVDRYVLVESIKPAPSITSKGVDEVIGAVEVA